MILWDFSSAALNRPKTHAPHNAGHRRSSVGLGSTYSLVDKHGTSSVFRSPGSVLNGRRTSMSNALGCDRNSLTDDTIRHPALPRSEVAILQPVVTVEVDGEIPVGLRFAPDKIMVVRKNAAIDTFTRPLPKRPSDTVASAAAGADRTAWPAGTRTIRQSPAARASRGPLPPLTMPTNAAMSSHLQQPSATTPTTPRHAIHNTAAVGSNEASGGITA